MKRKPIMLRRRHNGVGIVAGGAMAPAAYAVAVALKTLPPPHGPKTLDGRPLSLMLTPAEARALADQLAHFAGQAERASASAAAEGGAK